MTTNDLQLHELRRLHRRTCSISSGNEFLDEDEEEEDDGKVFAIYPISGGHNAGKPTVFKVYSRSETAAESLVVKEAADECKRWVDTISAVVNMKLERLERERQEQESGFLGLYQHRARWLYRTPHMQVFVDSHISPLVRRRLAGHITSLRRFKQNPSY